MDIAFWFWDFFWSLVFLFAPAGVANISASLSRHTKLPSFPINEEVFGPNKTWRGFMFGLLGAYLSVECLKILNPDGIISYQSMDLFSEIWFSIISSFGALGGDLVKSYFKRKKGIGPGVSWRPWDQIDWILGVNVLLMFLCKDYQVAILSLKHEGFELNVSAFLLVFPISVMLAIPIHMMFNQFACFVGLQKNRL